MEPLRSFATFRGWNKAIFISDITNSHFNRVQNPCNPFYMDRNASSRRSVHSVHLPTVQRYRNDRLRNLFRLKRQQQKMKQLQREIDHTHAVLAEINLRMDQALDVASQIPPEQD